jgi:hypothetical protein
MKIQNYELTIPEGREDQDGYIVLRHEQTYSLFLKNNNHTQCDVEVEIDGKHQGAWRLRPYQSVRLERPAHETGRFTFIDLNSEEGVSIGLDNINRSKLGLVTVTFTPEKEEPIGGGRGASSKGIDWGDVKGPDLENYEARSVSQNSYSAGGTGLTGKSDQEFGVANRIRLDQTKMVTINLRLVSLNIPGLRPLTSAPHSNPTPPPVG